MKAGRELDALVAEKVMGFTSQKDDDGVVIAFIDEPNERTYFFSDDECEFSPSTDISDAWEVVERFWERRIFHLGDALDENDKKIYYVNFQYNDSYTMRNYDAFAETAPLAICLAALNAVGMEVQ